MNKCCIAALTALATLTLQGCTTVSRGSIPVVESGVAVSNGERVGVNGANSYRMTPPPSIRAQPTPQDSGVVIMVPGANGGSAPISGGISNSAPITGSITTGGPVGGSPAINNPPVNAGNNVAIANPTWTAPARQAPTGIPSSSGGLAADEQLDGPVLALLTTAQKQQSSGDLNGASSSLERAQRIAPGEPQVMYRLAQVRLAQGDAAQAEQLARRALNYANGRPALQGSLWGIIAQARQKQGDAAGAAQAKLRAKAGA